jgi:hypothetical protein
MGLAYHLIRIAIDVQDEKTVPVAASDAPRRDEYPLKHLESSFDLLLAHGCHG